MESQNRCTRAQDWWGSGLSLPQDVRANHLSGPAACGSQTRAGCEPEMLKQLDPRITQGIIVCREGVGGVTEMPYFSAGRTGTSVAQHNMRPAPFSSYA